MHSSNHILLTIDVEDWFQVENFKRCIPFSSWSSYELRVEKNTYRLLDLLEEAGSQRSAFRVPQGPEQGRRALSSQLRDNCERVTDNGEQKKLRVTFFILGWIAERLPDLVREIHSRGHEVASHGYCHQLCSQCSPKELRTDLVDSKKLLEDIIGNQVYGYRAPSFSINNNILKLIEESGYLYDSSFNSYGMHGRYGKVDLPQNNNDGIVRKISETFFELPVSNLKFGNKILPWAGGGYFRLIPFPLFRLGVQSTLKKQGAYLFYAHPWEVDPSQPRVRQAPISHKFRHYANLSNTYSKLDKLLQSFTHCRFISCRQYLQEISEKFVN